MSTTTSQMGLKVPAAGDSDYPTSISDSFSSIDTHDHSSGKGKQIVSGGIADGAVTTAKVADASITAVKLASAAIDGTTLENTGTTVRIKDGGVTKPKLVALGQQVQDIAIGSTSSATQADFTPTALTLTITTTGRPVYIALVPDPAAIGGSPVPQSSLIRGTSSVIYVKRDGTNIFALDLGSELSPVFIDTAATAGSHTYQIQGKTSAGSISLTYCRFIVFEL